jgi:hypothetical protein
VSATDSQLPPDVICEDNVNAPHVIDTLSVCAAGAGWPNCAENVREDCTVPNGGPVGATGAVEAETGSVIELFGPLIVMVPVSVKTVLSAFS